MRELAQCENKEIGPMFPGVRSGGFVRFDGRVVGLLFLIGLAVPSWAQDDSMAYQEPKLEVALFDGSALPLEADARQTLLQALTEAASLPSVEPELRSKALAVALQFKPYYKPAFTANFLLKKGDLPPVGGTYGSPAELASAIMGFASELQKAPGNADAATLRGCLVEIAQRVDGNHVDAAYEWALLTQAKQTPSWSEILPATATIGNMASTTTGRPGGIVPRVAGDQPPKEGELAKMQSLVKGLLVRQMEANQFAGKASQMNATATRTGGSSFRIGFNQEVGPDMASALREVTKFLDVRYQGVPAGYTVEIAFQEQYIPKDGPSAAVACALLLNDLMVGGGLDPGFAVTGDMNADGSVQPVGGITGKIRGAASLDCDVVAIPHANSRVVSDLYILEGPQAVLPIQIFRLQTFDEAFALASVHDRRPEDLREAIELFAQVQEVLQRPNGLRYLTNPQVIAKLRRASELAPHHLSAKLLLLHGLGKPPKQLSLQGSLGTIDRSAEPLLRALRQENFDRSSGLEGDDFGDAYYALRRVRAKLDQRTWKFADAIITYAGLMRTFVNNRPRTQKGLSELFGQISTAKGNVSKEYENLHGRVDVQEELMRN